MKQFDGFGFGWEIEMGLGSLINILVKYIIIICKKR